jgi:hypothetical protein
MGVTHGGFKRRTPHRRLIRKPARLQYFDESG